jgi:endonuclease/exonuclease/phosphatase family metal-dependent hydrolase
VHRCSIRTAFAVALALGLSGCSGGSDEETLPPAKPVTVMTFNVLCSVCNPSEYDPWQDRIDYFADIFQRYDPDLLGTQELSLLGDEVGDLLARLPGRAAIYYHPDDRPPNPDATIFYRTSRFKPLESGHYWLSPTPDVPGSTGFADPQLSRLVTWARFHDKYGNREVFFATTHFDNNAPSQELSAPVVEERTAPFAATLPVIFVGDFNSKPETNAYSILTTDASKGFVFQNTFDLAPAWQASSNQDPPPAYDPVDRIDHIFVAGTGNFEVSDWTVDQWVYGASNRYPSDHFPIVSRFDYGK